MPAKCHCFKSNPGRHGLYLFFFFYLKFNCKYYYRADDSISTKLGKNSKFVITATPLTGPLPYSNDVLQSEIHVTAIKAYL